jgi:cysteine desulfuration protein SufE
MPRTVPPALQSIAALFEKCSESERRELLLHYAATAGRFAPRPDESFDVSDLRHDPECADKVGIHLRMVDGSCHFRIAPGPEVQTLTRALAAILCEGLEGARPDEVLSLPDAFPEEIAGSTLTRLRFRTVPYILHRMKEAVSGLLQRPADTTKQ